MTIFGWDASHYDGALTPTILARAKAEGITFFTHKIAEGLTDTEGTADDTALSAARSVGVEFLGGYLVPRSNASPAAQVGEWIALADASEPWWRTFPGWFWQVDLERWSYDSVPASVGIACAQQLRAATGRWTILYASRGQYGDQLAAWDGPLWNADYVSAMASFPSSMYPGDGWQPGWAPYSGKTPTFLQYTSAANIGGLTTCDANAFRGSVTDLRTLIEGEDMTSEQELLLREVQAMLIMQHTLWAPTEAEYVAAGGIKNVYDQIGQGSLVPKLAANQAELLAAIKAISLGGVDVVALAAAITAGVVANHDALTAADTPVIQAAVLDALRAGTGIA